MDLIAYFMPFFSSFTALFAIIDPFAVIPIFLSLTDRHAAIERAYVAKKAAFIACVILLVFALTGEGIFKIFGISIPAFRIAGGILLLKLGVEQLSARRERVKTEEETESLARDDISIFPIATPLLAGPGAISTVVLQASQKHGAADTGLFALAIVLVFILSYYLLKSAPALFRILGQTGLNLVTRIMGIILSAIAVQFIIDGAISVWKQMHG